MRTQSIITAVAVLCLLNQQVRADFSLSDGGTHDITTYHDNGVVDVSAPASGYTTVNLLSGGSVTSLSGYNRSHINIDGGNAGSLNAYDTSQVALNTGVITYQLGTWDTSAVTMNGGQAHYLYAYESSQATMNGGYVHTLGIRDHSQVTINGGTIGYEVAAFDYGLATITGGHFSQMSVYGFSEATLVGSGFGVYRDQALTDQVFSGFGDFDSHSVYDSGVYYLSGTLASGDPLFARLIIDNVGELSLVAVPLPGAALLAILGLSAAGMHLRRRSH